MKLVVKRDLKNNNYSVELAIEDIKTEDTELFSDFGYPQVNVGGSLTKSESKDVVTGKDDEGNDVKETVKEEKVIANLGNEFKYLPTEFPITRTFTQAQHGKDAEAIANQYVEEMKKRVTETITELKAKRDEFTGKEEIVL
ncbi:hypothetical protein ACFVRU_23340 [Streptomyces sp. NPDC057927]